MKYLLDTHTVLWSLFNPESVVSFWEISLKYSLGKLELKGVAPENIPTAVKETGFEIIDLAPRGASSFHKLPRLHKDPFDRMLI